MNVNVEQGYNSEFAVKNLPQSAIIGTDVLNDTKSATDDKKLILRS